MHCMVIQIWVLSMELPKWNGPWLRPAWTVTTYENVMELYLAIGLWKPWFRKVDQDPLNTRDICAFWDHIASEIMATAYSERLLAIQRPESVGEL